MRVPPSRSARNWSVIAPVMFQSAGPVSGWLLDTCEIAHAGEVVTASVAVAVTVTFTIDPLPGHRFAGDRFTEVTTGAVES